MSPKPQADRYDTLARPGANHLRPRRTLPMTAGTTPTIAERYAAITARADRNHQEYLAARVDILTPSQTDPELQDAIAGLVAALAVERFPGAAFIDLYEDYDRLSFGEVLDAHETVIQAGDDVAWQDGPLPGLQSETFLDLADELDVTGSVWGGGGIATFRHDEDGPRARINIAAALAVSPLA